MVTVYRFRVKDLGTDEWVVQISKATAQRIAQIGGRIIDGTSEEVSSSTVDEDGYLPSPRLTSLNNLRAAVRTGVPLA